MSETEIRISAPKGLSTQELEGKLNQVLRKSETELIAIAKKHSADLSSLNVEDVRKLCQAELPVRPVGGGVDPVTIALLVSLTPLVKALTPILKPGVKSASKVAEKIALDVWEHMKTKMWENDHVVLREKKN